MPSLKDALQKPANVGDPIEVAAPQIAQRAPIPPYVPNPQGGLATGSMGPAPATFTTPYDSIRQFIRPGVAQNRFPPLPTKANPQLNAATRTIVDQAIASTSGKIELEAPSIFTLTDQTVALPGPLVLALADEPQNTVFAGPASSTGAGGIDQTTNGTTLATDPYVLTAVPSAYPEFAICGVSNAAGGVFSLDGSWTQVGSGGTEKFGYKEVTSGNCVATISNGVVSPLGAIMTLFAVSGTPSSIQNTGTTAMTMPGTTTFGFSNPVTTGDTIVVQVTGNGPGGSPTSIGPITVSDNKGNVYSEMGAIDTIYTIAPGWNQRYYISQWVCINVNGGAGFAVSVVSTGGSCNNHTLNMVEFSNIVKLVTSSTPTFRALVNADLPVVDVSHGGTGLAMLPANSVLLGEGTAPVGAAAPSTAGYFLRDNGVGVDPSFAALPSTYYQTVEQAGSAKTQRPILNFLAPITATDDAGNTSTDIAVPVFVGSGASHATGLVPDPGASAGTTKFLREDGTWAVAGGAGTAVEINGVGVSSDKLIYINGAPDGATVWGIDVNGSPDGG